MSTRTAREWHKDIDGLRRHAVAAERPGCRTVSVVVSRYSADESITRKEYRCIACDAPVCGGKILSPCDCGPDGVRLRALATADKCEDAINRRNQNSAVRDRDLYTDALMAEAIRIANCSDEVIELEQAFAYSPKPQPGALRLNENGAK